MQKIPIKYQSTVAHVTSRSKVQKILPPLTIITHHILYFWKFNRTNNFTRIAKNKTNIAKLWILTNKPRFQLNKLSKSITDRILIKPSKRKNFFLFKKIYNKIWLHQSPNKFGKQHQENFNLKQFHKQHSKY